MIINNSTHGNINGTVLLIGYVQGTVTDRRSPAPKREAADNADKDARPEEPRGYAPSSTSVRPINPANQILYPVGGDHVVELLHDRGQGRIRVRVLDAAEHEDWDLYAPGTIYTGWRSQFSDSPPQHEDDDTADTYPHAECFGAHPGGADGIVDCDGQAI